MNDFALHCRLFCCKLRVLCALAGVLILTGVATGDEGRPADAVTVFHCTFGENWDVDYDGWPDRWVRQTGPNYPPYVNVAIADDDSAPNGRALCIKLDGASAAVSSPVIRVLPRFSYVFEARVKNSSLAHSRAVISLDFCDTSGRVLQTVRSQPLSNTDGWNPVELGPVEPAEGADRVVIRIEAMRPSKGDLQGQVAISDIWLSRRPRIAISTNNPSNVYTETDGVVVRCELSGIREAHPEIQFQLYDSTNKLRQSEKFPVDCQRIVDNTANDETTRTGVKQTPDGYEGSAQWRPNIPDYGYYRVEVKLVSAEAPEDQNEGDRQLKSSTIYLAVAPPLPSPRRGEFGWTLPHGGGPLNYQDLSQLLPHVGINWVKLPVWFDASNPRRGDEVIRFVELLGASNIEVVGIIDRPPAGSELASRFSRNVPIADLLALDSSVWAPALEPIMTRLSLRVRWWQLGGDRDLSFAGIPNLNQRIQDLRTALFRFGQEVRLGINWDWNTEPQSGEVAWNFQQLTAEKTPDDEQFEKLLTLPAVNSAERWINVESPPLPDDDKPKSESSSTARASALVRRLISAKIHGADAIIVSNPFDDQNGLMRADGMPGELLLPWRTTALMLAGSEYLGEFQLPSGSSNRIFLRPDGQVVMVLWNDEPTREVLYLGRDVTQIDILGRSSIPTFKGREQVIEVGSTPTFVLGLNEAITRFRMAARFEKTQVPSVFAKPHRNSVVMKNFFQQGIGGSLKIVVLEGRPANHDANGEAATETSSYIADRWVIDPPQAVFQLAPNEELKFPFDVRLKNALFGTQPVRIDFRIEADEEYQFSVYQQMEVGTDDMTLDVYTRIDKDGVLIVEQRMTNKAERLADFRCYLHAQGHRRQRMQVYRLGPEVDRKVYRFPEGRELLGQEMLLEIEELNGPRMVKYRFVAENQGELPSEVPTTVAPSKDESPSERQEASDANLASRL